MEQETSLTMDFLHSLIKANAGKIEALEKSAAKHGRALRDIEEEYPLLPPEADDLNLAVRKKVVDVLGGKNSNAYKNKDLRNRTFRDLWGEIKRQYGLINEKGRQLSYKKIKRKYYQGALIAVAEYEAPIVIANEITTENDLGDMDE